MVTEAQTAALADKITTALNTLKKPTENGEWALTHFLITTLNMDDWDYMDEMEKVLGEKQCNEWLVDVLTSSHTYTKCDDNHVVLKKE